MANSTSRRDLFISHASENKESFVRPLAHFLSRAGCSIWFDEFEIKPGDSLADSIDRGIRTSKFGLIVLSHAFLGKHWTNEELRGFRTMEAAKLSKIIPLWLDVNHDDVINFSPILADKYAIKAHSGIIPAAGVDILKVVRPDLLEFIRLNSALAHNSKTAPRKRFPATDIQPGPIMHESLSVNVLSRIRLLQACIADVDPSPLDKWIEDFSRDWHPHRELLWWESFVSVFIKLSRAMSGHAERIEVYESLFDTLNGTGRKGIEDLLNKDLRTKFGLKRI